MVLHFGSINMAALYTVAMLDDVQHSGPVLFFDRTYALLISGRRLQCRSAGIILRSAIPRGCNVMD
jgi:hypothetical protein